MILKYALTALALMALTTPTFTSAQEAASELDCDDPENAEEDECALLLPANGAGDITNFAPIAAPAAAAAAVIGLLAGGGGGGNGTPSTPTTPSTPSTPSTN